MTSPDARQVAEQIAVELLKSQVVVEQTEDTTP